MAHLYVNNKEITTGDQTGILNKSFAYTGRIKLNYLQNVFSIGFSTDNFLHIGGGEVEYRLMGYNDEWSENRLGNDITYTNISPGDYVFEIRLKKLPGSNQIIGYNDYATFLCHLVAILFMYA